MRCAVCGNDNQDGVFECATCGKVFAARETADTFAETMAGFEPTVRERDLHDLDGLPVPPLPGIEQTRLLPADLALDVEPSFEVERTPIEADPGAATTWTTGQLEIEPTLAPDDGERTPRGPETAACPWCGAPSVDAVCDGCGRRKNRYLAPVPETPRVRAAPGDRVMCPACFSKVSDGDRCSECGLPFPLQEIL